MNIKKFSARLQVASAGVALAVMGIWVSALPATAIAATVKPLNSPHAQPPATLPMPTPPQPGSGDMQVATTSNDYSQKGLPGKATTAPSGKSTRNSVTPLTTCSPACYFYGTGQQTPTPAPTGVYANMKVSQPYVSSSDYHSLGEIAVESTDEQQIVEAGWTVDTTGVNGTDHTKPHLFVYHWVNGSPTCYNACGFVQYTGSGSTLVGADLSSAVGTAKAFGIEYKSGNWWIAYNGGWVGYFPGTLWSGATPPATFTNAGLYQIFGEVAASTDTPCTDMGNGIMANAANANTSTGAAYFSSTTFVGTATPSMNIFTTPATSVYGVYVPTGTTRSFYYGGPGYGGVTGGC